VSVAPHEVWAKISAPLPTTAIAWRADGKPTARDGKYIARFVAYIEANTVRDRLDSVVPGEWDLTLELLPSLTVVGGDGEASDTPYSFKATLDILGVKREDVGHGKDYKQASTDAFKRVAVRFGIGHELYAYEQNWVELDGDGKYAKPVMDPNVAYQRRYGSGAEQQKGASSDNPAPGVAAGGAPAALLTDLEIVSCPKCGGRCWDNRLTKRNPKAPDYKCQNRSCDGVIWPPKESKTPTSNAVVNQESADSYPGVLHETADDLPF
jgi:hypothetical protein